MLSKKVEVLNLQQWELPPPFMNRGLLLFLQFYISLSRKIRYEEELVALLKSIFVIEVEKRPTIFELKKKLEELTLFDQLDR